MKVVIFAGPSLPPAVRPADPRFDWRPPARGGDVYRAAVSRPAAIGLIDGYFESVPAVRHKEILFALGQGVPVYGAASIGALRAAELDRYGMIGVGRIYQWYRDGIIEDDDEVALLHGPEELGYPLLTVPMVSVRATIGRDLLNGDLALKAASALIASAKAVFYKDRSFKSESGLRQSYYNSGNTIETGNCSGIDQKYLDASLMIDEINKRISFDSAPSVIE